MIEGFDGGCNPPSAFKGICPLCERQGLKGNVFRGPGVSTAMYCEPFYDENGGYHHHEGNNITDEYSCSNDHRFTHSYKPYEWRIEID